MCCFVPDYLVLPGKALFLVSRNEVLLQSLFQGVFQGGIDRRRFHLYPHPCGSLLGRGRNSAFYSGCSLCDDDCRNAVAGGIPGVIA